MSDDEMVGAYAKRVGERLRTIRRQQRHSLQGVEEASGQEFKASVLGAYERGERSISVPRLQRLAKFYSVPVDQLLPRDAGPEPGWSSGGADADGDSPDESITLDLIRLEEVEMPGKDILLRFVNALQVQRQDFNGKVLTMRHDDVRLIALMLGVSSTQLRQALHIAELIA